MKLASCGRFLPALCLVGSLLLSPIGEAAAADKIFLSNQKLEEGNRLNLVISEEAYRQAVQCWTEAIELNPRNALAYEARGYYFHLPDVAKYAQAIGDYSHAIELNPGKGENYYFRGSCYLSLHEDEAAEKDFRRAIELDPSMSAPYGDIAYIYAKQTEADTAIEYANKALERDDRNSVAYYSRGLGYFTKGDYEKAMGDGEKPWSWGTPMPIC
ncbi:MAG: tetratricopeptide repeat protein [Selenomonadaceae bacterium]|nr:tetratricopeptide repeat protein [Selenomonadaceae bacterium]